MSQPQHAKGTVPTQTRAPVVTNKVPAAAPATAPAASVPTSPNATTPAKPPNEPTDEEVLQYLKKRGLQTAILELHKTIQAKKGATNDATLTTREQLEQDDQVTRTQRTLLSRATGGGFGYDTDGAPLIAQWGVPDVEPLGPDGKPNPLGVDEARAYLNSYTDLQSWILTLPDDPSAQPSSNTRLENVAKSLVTASGSVIESVPPPVLLHAETLERSTRDNDSAGLPLQELPPSAKPELLAVSFALLVHTYCELLEVGMQSSAHMILATFRSIFEPTYNDELKDLDALKTKEDMLKLNTQNSTHLEALAKLKRIMIEVANYQLKKDDLASKSNAANAEAVKIKLGEYDHNISVLQEQYQRISTSATRAFDQLREYPFLRRARAVRWQLHLSSTSYALLAAFLSSRESLLPMSTLLQTRCEVHVENRDPVPFIPTCIMDDFAVSSRHRHKSRNELEVNWATPSVRTEKEKAKDLPFPPLKMAGEYETTKEAAKAKVAVSFNQSLLVHGFRRLLALERKQEYETGLLKQSEDNKDKKKQPLVLNNPLEPSVLMSTLCASSPTTSSSSRRAHGPTDASSIWCEPGVGITCAKSCPPDGRRVATGCDDAAVRVFSIMDKQPNEAIKETSMVLLGHKNGFPVFDVDWNRNGRHLLSAGGDGSVRLWDTMAVGPYGTVTKPSQPSTRRTSLSGKDKKKKDETETMEVETEMGVPGTKEESNEPRSGAALAVYRGHAPSCPVWSVSFAPSGYYFASTGSDATGRIWTTDRTTPVRILTGHTSTSVHCVEWHPNCNYVLTGGDDRTVRMWDVQSGRCMRLLNGGASGIHALSVCPSGQYCAGADALGTIHLWDLGSGKKVNELRTSSATTKGSKRDHAGNSVLRMNTSKSIAQMVHALSFSACGTALASGGDDRTVHIWDIKRAYDEGARPGLMKPHHSFRTRRTMILDLTFTKRNMLLGVGSYTMPLLPAPVLVEQ